MKHALLARASIAVLATAASPTSSQSTPTQAFEIGDGVGGFSVDLADYDYFGLGVCSAGDLDGDGNADLMVGAPGIGNILASVPGEVFVLFLEADGTVRSHTRIGNGAGGFSDALGIGDEFGRALARLGDLDGNGREEFAVAGPAHDEGIGQTGAVWIIELDAAGIVTKEEKIGPVSGGFGGSVTVGGRFGSALVSIGDVDGDGTSDLAVGNELDEDGGVAVGAVWILFMRPDSGVRAVQKLSAQQGGLPFTLEKRDIFGSALGAPGDVDGDGVPDLVVGAVGDDDAQDSAGAAYVLFLQANGTPYDATKITTGQANFMATLDASANFGYAITSLGDLDGNGSGELAISAPEQFITGLPTGAVWILELNGDGTVLTETQIDGTHPAFAWQVRAGDDFGSSLACVPDGRFPWLVFGARSTAQGEELPTGSLWLLQMCDGDPVASFTLSADGIGPDPHTVAFQNTSTGAGAIAWLWDFGDGTTSTAEHPTHVYSGLGTYSVVLRATGAEGACAEVQRDLVTVVTPASVTSRNGGGGNPDILTAANTPILGASWGAQIDGSSLGATGFSFLYAYDDALTGFPTAFGELLVDVTSPAFGLDTNLFLGGIASHSFDVPNDLALIEVTGSAQGLLLSSRALTNALDFVLGL